MKKVVQWLSVFAVLAMNGADARTVAQVAFQNYQEGVEICKAIAMQLPSQIQLLQEIDALTSLEERSQLFLEKAVFDASLLSNFRKHSIGNGIYLGNSYHAVPLAYRIPNSEGLYCGIGDRYLKEAEKSGGTQASWKLRKIYLEEFYKSTHLPWWECCMDVSQEDFLKLVKEASVIYRRGGLKRNLQIWASQIERQSLHDLEAALKKLEKSGENTSAYRGSTTRDTRKFLNELRELVK